MLPVNAAVDLEQTSPAARPLTAVYPVGMLVSMFVAEGASPKSKPYEPPSVLNALVASQFIVALELLATFPDHDDPIKAPASRHDWAATLDAPVITGCVVVVAVARRVYRARQSVLVKSPMKIGDKSQFATVGPIVADGK